MIALTRQTRALSFSLLPPPPCCLSSLYLEGGTRRSRRRRNLFSRCFLSSFLGHFDQRIGHSVCCKSFCIIITSFAFSRVSLRRASAEWKGGGDKLSVFLYISSQANVSSLQIFFFASSWSDGWARNTHEYVRRRRRRETNRWIETSYPAQK